MAVKSTLTKVLPLEDYRLGSRPRHLSLSKNSQGPNTNLHTPSIAISNKTTYLFKSERSGFDTLHD